MASGHSDGAIKIWNLLTGKLVRVLEGHEREVTSIAFSPEGKLLASGSTDKTIKIWLVSEGRLVRSIEMTDQTIDVAAFSPDGKFIASAGVGGRDGWSIKVWRSLDGSLLRTKKIGFPVWYVAFSPDGKFIASNNWEGGLQIWGVSDGKINRVFKDSDPVNYVAFSPDRRVIASKSDDNSVKIWSMKTGGVLARLTAVTRDTSIAVTPEGFFAGTGDFNKYVHFVKGLEVYDFNQFYDAFYRPDLVEKKLRGEDISKHTEGLTIEQAIKNPPPRIAILSPKEGEVSSTRTVTLKVRITDTGGGIGDIRVHHNGKLVESLGVYRLAKPDTNGQQVRLAKADIENPYQTAVRGTVVRRVYTGRDRKDIQVIAFSPLKGTVERTYQITLVKGENTISLSAFNGTNTVMSAMESVKVRAVIPERKPEVFVLSVGNDQFANPAFNLKMAVKDADDFSSLIKRVVTPLYGSVRVQTLANANKTSVLKAISSLTSQMKPEDTFILFAATHGRAEDDLYYIYTSDFTGDFRDPKTSLSSVELMELSKTIPALKQVFILDTCQSGGVENIVAGLYDSRISVLAKALGMHVFAGAKTYQDALDDYKGNGLFTHFLLRGLQGEADQNQDKVVTVSELNSYLARLVKEASKGRQEPFIRIFGEDLPLARVMAR